MDYKIKDTEVHIYACVFKLERTFSYPFYSHKCEIMSAAAGDVAPVQPYVNISDNCIHLNS